MDGERPPVLESGWIGLGGPENSGLGSFFGDGGGEANSIGGKESRFAVFCGFAVFGGFGRTNGVFFWPGITWTCDPELTATTGRRGAAGSLFPNPNLTRRSKPA